MHADENEVQILIRLGLTVLETRIYLALCKYENLTTKTISELTKTSQPDTYRVLHKLQDKGLIEKLIDNPLRFRAVPMETVVALLLERKRIDYNETETRSRLLLDTLKETKVDKPIETREQFVMIPKKEVFINRINDVIERSQETIDLSVSWKRYSFGITASFAESIEKAWQRGVRTRIVVESPKEASTGKQPIQVCRSSTFCDIRFVPRLPKTVIGIYDKKEIFIIVNPEESLLGSPALWSNNKSLIAFAEDYFEILWLTAMENPQLSK